MMPGFWRSTLFAPANIAGLLAAGLGAGLTLQPAPLFAWGGVEVLYLLFSFWKRKGAGPNKDLPAPEGWGQLAASQREQYRALRALRQRVEENLAALPGGKALGDVSQARLDALLNDFLRHLQTLNQYREFLGTAEPETTERERRLLADGLTGEESPDLREVKQRRLDILEQRLARIAQVRASREVVAHELAAIEDLVRLAYEQSVAIRDPARASDALAALSEQAKAAEETLRELERFRDLGLPERGR
jgi:hypothetical protein